MFFKSKKDRLPERLFRVQLSQVVEKTAGEERILGKNGGASLVGEEIVIVCNGSEVFRCEANGCEAAELMSGNGCDIRGMSGGVKKHVVVYYSRNK